MQSVMDTKKEATQTLLLPQEFQIGHSNLKPDANLNML